MQGRGARVGAGVGFEELGSLPETLPTRLPFENIHQEIVISPTKLRLGHKTSKNPNLKP